MPALACANPQSATTHRDLEPIDVKAALDSIFDGIMWKAVPKKRQSLERRKKRWGNFINTKYYMTPKKGIVLCMKCGEWHEKHTLCGM